MNAFLLTQFGELTKSGMKNTFDTDQLAVFAVKALVDSYQVAASPEGLLEAVSGSSCGAKGMLWASQVAPGNENTLRLRIYGEKGGLDWAQEDPNYLWFTPFGQEKRLITRGGAGSGEAAGRVSRVPPGHPEGYLEGFANIYTEAARAIRASAAGEPVPQEVIFPTAQDGLLGVSFIDACVRSSARDSAWVKMG